MSRTANDSVWMWFRCHYSNLPSTRSHLSGTILGWEWARFGEYFSIYLVTTVKLDSFIYSSEFFAHHIAHELFIYITIIIISIIVTSSATVSISIFLKMSSPQVRILQRTAQPNHHMEYLFYTLCHITWPIQTHNK